MKRQRSEDQIQRAVFDYLRRAPAPGLVAFHVPNGGARSRTEAAILQGLGVLAGVPDIIAIMPHPFCEEGYGYFRRPHVYAMELKSPGRRNRVTGPQEAVQASLREAGVEVAVCVGVDEAIAQIEKWGLVRGKKT